jgi:tRNA(Ile)-lysidine synthase
MPMKKPLIDAVTRCIEKYKISKSKIVVSVSTGVDSMVLLDVLLQLKNVFSLTISVLHFNHQLRDESANEEAFILSYCKERNILCEIERLDVKEYMETHSVSLEMAAHDLRYQKYYRLIEDHSNTWIATAHHHDDVLESVLMNLGKGVGRERIQGVAEYHPPFIRPFYQVNKSDITEYQKENKIPFFEDDSNSDQTIERNFWRNEIIPHIQKYYGEGYQSGVLKTVKNLNWQSHDYDLLKSELNKIDFSKDYIEIDIDHLKRFFSEFIKRFVENLIHRRFKKRIILTHDQFTILLNLFTSESGKKIDIDNHIEISKQFDKIRINTIFKRPSIDIQYEPNSSINLNGFQLVSKWVNTFHPIDQSTIEYIDFENVHGTMHIRHLEAGDSFQPVGMSGTQKVNRLLKSAQVKPADRANVYVLCDDIGILWVIGYRISERVKITDRSKKILKMEVVNAARN